jgi:hypothetical protein
LALGLHRIGFPYLRERLAHPRRDGSPKNKLDACRRRMERLVRVKRVLVSEIGFLDMPCEESAEPKHEAFAGDSTKTRRNPSTQPKPETRQRLGELLAHKPSIRLGGDSTENLAAGFPSYWISISSRTSKLIRGDESVENQSNTSSPSDGASCSESLIGCWCKRVWGDPFLPIGEALAGWVIGAIIGIVIVKVLL